MSKSRALMGLAAAFIAALAYAAFRFGPALIEPEDAGIGIMLGEMAPVEIPMRNSAGDPTTLAEISGRNGTVLLMTRSVDWCPFCAAQVKDHAEITDKLSQRGFTLASLSYDEPAILARFKQDFAIPYVMLSDVESRFVSETGLRDPQYERDSMAYGVPYATTLVLGPEGQVLNKLVSEDYRQRPSNETVLAMVDEVAN